MPLIDADGCPIHVEVEGPEAPVGLPVGLRAHRVHIEEGNGVAACSDEIVEHAETARRRDSPRKHVLTAHAVLELRLALEHQNLAALSSEHGGQGRSSETAPDDDYVNVQDFLRVLQ